MLMYQVRERTFRVQRNLEFPNNIELKFVFRPDAAFGNAGADGRTWRQSTPGRVVFSANTGHFKIDPKNLLEELDVACEHTNVVFRLSANRLSLTTYCGSNRELTQLIESVYYVFPYVLGFCFRDPVVIDRVEGLVGSEPFAWELASLEVPIVISNQSQQEQRVVKAWDLLTLLSSLDNMRVVGAQVLLCSVPPTEGRPLSMGVHWRDVVELLQGTRGALSTIRRWNDSRLSSQRIVETWLRPSDDRSAVHARHAVTKQDRCWPCIPGLVHTPGAHDPALLYRGG